MSSRTGNAFRGFVRDRAQDAREVADASEAGRTPAPHERKVFSGRERLTADTSWIVTIILAYFLPVDAPDDDMMKSTRGIDSRLAWHASRIAKEGGERGLDFAKSGKVFFGPHLTREDMRCDYGVPRYITFGWLDYRMVVLVWTPRGEVRRIISMRYANEREITRYSKSLG